eukprot:TRINITY_DN13028_c0_g1_i2.p1 TRINITY_DN13028_c0_g1~~TRINITY_DN13028_c0_g1_i2.p1  ORF type:complete len:916 (-),score=92.38 TRINITY_DN13028_c0_g1_i2:137-2785(-)
MTDTSPDGVNLSTRPQSSRKQDEKCKLCPEGQQDSKECKDMFTAYMFGVSVYNFVAPGPIDLAICCPCMTQRFLELPPDTTSLGRGDAVKLFGGTSGTRPDLLVSRLRATAVLRVYREHCQVTFTTWYKMMKRMNIDVVPRSYNALRATRDAICSAMEYSHPELSYYWAEEMLNQACPALMPYTVKLQLSEEKNKHGLQLHPEKVKQLREFASNEGLRKAMLGMKEMDAGKTFVSWLHSPDRGAVSNPVDFSGRGEPPCSSDGLLKLEEWFPDALKDENSTDLADHLSEVLDDVVDNANPLPTRRLLALRKYRDYLKKSFESKDEEKYDSTSLYPYLMRALDPIGLRDIPGGEKEVLTLKIVGYREPKITEERSRLYSMATAALYGGLAGYMVMGFVAAVLPGTMFLPLFGILPITHSATILGVIAGFVQGTFVSTTASSRDGTLILQGWSVVAGPQALRSPTQRDIDDIYVNYLASSCKLYQGKRGRTSKSATPVVPAHTKIGTRWRAAGNNRTDDEVSGGLAFWQNVVIHTALVRERHLEQGPWESSRVGFNRRVVRRQWLGTQIASFQNRSGDGEELTQIFDELPPPKMEKMENTAQQEPSVDGAKDEGDVENLPPLIGDMPEECWTQSVGSFMKTVWDRFLGSNGRGLACKNVAKFLDVGVAGVRVLVLDPLQDRIRWLQNVRPPTFWYEYSTRDADSVTGAKLTELLTRAALEASYNIKTNSHAAEGNRVFMAPIQFDKDMKYLPKRLPIYAYLVTARVLKDGRSTYRPGPRVGVVSAGEAIGFTSIFVSASLNVFVKVKFGWLAPCRYIVSGGKRVTASLRESALGKALGLQERVLGRLQCARHLKRAFRGSTVYDKYMKEVNKNRKKARWWQQSH